MAPRVPGGALLFSTGGLAPPGSSAWTTSGDVEVVLNVNSLLTFIPPQLCVSWDGDELWEISIEGLVRSRLIKRSNMRQNSLHYFQL